MKSLIRIFTYLSIFYYLVAFKILFVTNYKRIDDELRPFTEEYHALLDKYCDTKNYNTSNFYSITFVNSMNDGDIGVCYRKINGYSIEVNKQWWDAVSENDRRQLIYHEMAHCLIYKDHVDDKNNYMNPYFNRLQYNDLADQASLDIYNRCH